MRWLLIVPVRLYQILISPWLPKVCRYQPSCSAYMLQALHAHGLFKGAWYGTKRLLRCAPWGGHGYDPVPGTGTGTGPGTGTGTGTETTEAAAKN